MGKTGLTNPNCHPEDVSLILEMSATVTNLLGLNLLLGATSLPGPLPAASSRSLLALTLTPTQLCL